MGISMSKEPSTKRGTRYQSMVVAMVVQDAFAADVWDEAVTAGFALVAMHTSTDLIKCIFLSFCCSFKLLLFTFVLS